MRALLLVAFLALPVLAAAQTESAPPPSLRIAEVVADPHTDWNDDARVTPSDEFIELWNEGATDVSLEGWQLFLNDTTPERWNLAGVVRAGERRAFVNPPGEVNNNGHIALLAPTGPVDAVRYGTWPGNAAGVPSGGATGPNDEALRWTTSGWAKGHATPNAPPTGPTVLHRPPFPRNEGTAFHTGNASHALRADWVDADRSFARADLVMMEDGARVPSSLSSTAGRWTATGQLTTPIADFTYRWEFIDADGRTWPGATTPVTLDREAPARPTLNAPAWTNGSSVALRGTPAPDAGVAGVTYAFERWETDAWTRIGEWSPDRELYVPLSADTTFRLLARDALGWTAASVNATVRHDADPPAGPTLASEGGYDSVRLRWVAPDDASGIVAYDLRRTADATERTWRLGPVQEHTDRGFRLGDDLAYSLRALDAAGNVGPWTHVNATYEGHDPRLRALRVNREVWGTSDLRIHLDFDRPMGTAAPRFLLRGPGATESPEGRWLANRSTYLIELEGETERPEGRVTLRLEAATDDRGRALPAPVERQILIDRTAPVLRAGWTDGWIAGDTLRLVAEDAHGPFLRHRIGDGEWVVSNAVAVVPVQDGDRVRAVATDAAGLRSGEVDRIVHVDRDPPRLKGASWNRDRLVLDLADDGAGLGAVNATTPAGALALVGRTLMVGSAAVVDVVATDRVGNEAHWRLERPAPAPAATQTSPKSRAIDTPGAPRESHFTTASSHAVPVTATAGGLGLAALGVLGVVRRHRPPRSLAARLRALASQGSTRS